MTKQEMLQRVIETLEQRRKEVQENLTSKQATISQRAQAEISEINLGIAALEKIMASGFPPYTGEIGIGSLVEVRTERNESETYFVLPTGSGIEIVNKKRTIFVVASPAPLALALIGKRKGEETIVQIGDKQRKLKILKVS